MMPTASDNRCAAFCGGSNQALQVIAGIAALAISITILALSAISFIILPFLITFASVMLLGAVINAAITEGSTARKIGVFFLGILYAGLLVGLYFVAPIAVPIAVIAGTGLACCFGSSGLLSSSMSAGSDASPARE